MTHKNRSNDVLFLILIIQTTTVHPRESSLMVNCYLKIPRLIKKEKQERGRYEFSINYGMQSTTEHCRY